MNIGIKVSAWIPVSNSLGYPFYKLFSSRVAGLYDAKSWLIGKDSDAGRDWGQEEKGTAEDEMAGWYHWLDGRESEWSPGVGDGQGGLACCDSWGRKEWTRLNDWSDLMIILLKFLRKYLAIFHSGYTIICSFNILEFQFLCFSTSTSYFLLKNKSF